MKINKETLQELDEEIKILLLTFELVFKKNQFTKIEKEIDCK